jgi:hypothetical protein
MIGVSSSSLDELPPTEDELPPTEDELPPTDELDALTEDELPPDELEALLEEDAPAEEELEALLEEDATAEELEAPGIGVVQVALEYAALLGLFFAQFEIASAQFEVIEPFTPSLSVVIGPQLLSHLQ